MKKVRKQFFNFLSRYAADHIIKYHVFPRQLCQESLGMCIFATLLIS